MKRGIHLSILALLLLSVTAGCAKYETSVDRFYGTSYELAKQSQINNPHAGIETGPPVGVEGTIASKIIIRYESGFDKPAPKTKIYSIETSGVDIE